MCVCVFCALSQTLTLPHSNRLSIAINELTNQLSASALWDDLELRRLVLSEALPGVLQRAVGLDQCLARVPLPYLRAMFSSHLASHFVYQHGIEANQLSFFTFMNGKIAGSRKK